MADDRKSRGPEDAHEEAPGRADGDWDAVRGVETVPARPSDGKDVPLDRSGRVDTDEHYAEGQDNPYMESDDALPDDEEERVFRRNNAREGGRFDET
ncbi:hypothetical protein [Chelativorans sp. AA-79]|uniref:hypothetical protein n=1 Tax=Chelativorans sp. AA-79 TaxID=3028735 RepID=UPI0023F6251B|nr:hypothetical protein [Chelativorans sp. AA-79]WEX10189.1 hypothetical protein PVE73_04315 [Chelativorans sp. AA-79]